MATSAVVQNYIPDVPVGSTQFAAQRDSALLPAGGEATLL